MCRLGKMTSDGHVAKRRFVALAEVADPSQLPDRFAAAIAAESATLRLRPPPASG